MGPSLMSASQMSAGAAKPDERDQHEDIADCLRKHQHTEDREKRCEDCDWNVEKERQSCIEPEAGKVFVFLPDFEVKKDDDAAHYDKR